MRQVLFEVPGLGFRLHSFGLTMLLACLAALYLTAWRARREKLDPDDVFGLALWLFSGGIIGARVFFILQHPETIRSVGDLVRIWQGGIVFYGCITGGLIGSLLYWRRHPFPFRPMADAVAPSLMIGLAFGRVGCFCNGCCYGDVTSLPWALRFPAGTLPWARQVEAGLIPEWAPSSLPMHPTQLYAVLGALGLLALLTLYHPRRRRDGEVMALLMVTYPVVRFINEILRGDEPAVLGGLTAAQAISIGLLAAGIATWIYLSRRPMGRFADQLASPVRLPAPKGGKVSSPMATSTGRRSR